jgi:cyclic pyranopterin phosphate synthase
MHGGKLLVDSHGRVLRDLRVSVTDRCNFRCLYCLPETEAAANFYRGRWAHPNAPATPIQRQWAPRSQILSFEEIERVIRIAVDLGIEKVRLTGGEPLLRHDVEVLVERVARIPGIKDLALTTNGFLFQQKARALRDAGLRRISFSLDSLDPANFKKITGRDGLSEVLDSIALAQELGLNPVKVNAVIIRGLNDHEIEPLVEFAQRQRFHMRFIEFMPLDSKHAWQRELVVPGYEILKRLHARFRLEPVASSNKSETAKRWRVLDDCQSRAREQAALIADDPAREQSPSPVGVHTSACSEIGIIAPVSEPFCGHCNRLRLTADGKVRTCLFSIEEHDLRSRLRAGATDADLQDYLKEVVWHKEPGHKIGRADFVPPPRSMSCIGG